MLRAKGVNDCVKGVLLMVKTCCVVLLNLQGSGRCVTVPRVVLLSPINIPPLSASCLMACGDIRRKDECCA